MHGVNNNKPSIVKSIGILSVLMAISKVLSLIREVAIASFYGASSSTDAYFVAGGFVTNVFFGITAAMSIVFLPYYIQLKKERSEREKSEEVSSLMVSLVSFAIILIAALFVLAPWIIRVIAPSYVGKQYSEAVLYMRIYSITILFSLLNNLLTAVLNAESRYGFGAIASVVYSVTSIICMVALRKYIGVTALAMSVPLSFFIQLLILLVVTRRYISFRFVFKLFNPALKRLLLLMVPVLLSNATVEINQLMTRSIATGLDEGAVSILSYSNTLFNFVSSLIVTTFITVYYTEMSNASKDDNQLVFNMRISQAINILIICMAPIAVITYIYSKDIVGIAYGRGRFDQKSVVLTASCLSIYAVIFVFDCIRNLLIKAFYAKNNTKTPLINSILSMLITVIGSFLLSRVIGVNGIVVSISASIIIAAVFLAINANHQICKFDSKRIIRTITKVTLSAVITYAILFMVSLLTLGKNKYYRFGLACVLGFGIYLISLTLFKCEELDLVFSVIRHRNRKGN